MVIRLLIFVFLLEWIALLIALVLRVRWLTIQDVGRVGFGGLLKEVKAQLAGWPLALLVATPVTFLALLSAVLLGFRMAE